MSARMPMLILCILTLTLVNGCANLSAHKPAAYVLSFNVSLESQIDPANKAKIVVELKTDNNSNKAGK